MSTISRSAASMQQDFVRLLQSAGIKFVITHYSSIRTGAPALMVINKPPVDQSSPGVVVLFKGWGRAPKQSQLKWLDEATANGWRTIIAYALEDAVNGMTALGYQI